MFVLLLKLTNCMTHNLYQHKINMEAKTNHKTSPFSLLIIYYQIDGTFKQSMYMCHDIIYISQMLQFIKFPILKSVTTHTYHAYILYMLENKIRTCKLE